MDEEDITADAAQAAYNRDIEQGLYEADTSFRDHMASVNWQPITYAEGVEWRPGRP